MKSIIQPTLLFLLISLIISSCVTRKELTYLKYSDKSFDGTPTLGETRVGTTPSAYKIMPYDNLYIRVITPDPQWSELFNTMPVGAGGAVTEESAGLFGYPVDANGYIEIPFVGQVLAGGKTLSEVRIALDSIFKNYVTDASITVRLVNNYVSVLGEVRNPGRYPLSKDRVNIFEVLSMAGDLREFGNRQRVQLIRPSPYGPVIKEFSLGDRSILSSELYYIMPNDIIYAMPSKGRSFQINSSVWQLFLTTITSALGVIGFFRTL
jgi:polysaccharide export outer membrane protein